MRSALIWLGEDDPCDTMEAARAEDPERAALRDVLEAWADPNVIGVEYDIRLTLTEVLKKAQEINHTTDGNPYDKGERVPQYPYLHNAVLPVAMGKGGPSARAFGYWARRNKGRVIDGKRLVGQSDGNKHANGWWIEKVTTPAPSSSTARAVKAEPHNSDDDEEEFK